MALLKIIVQLTGGVLGVIVILLGLFIVLMIPRVTLDVYVTNQNFQIVVFYGFLRKKIHRPNKKHPNATKDTAISNQSHPTKKKHVEIDWGAMIYELLELLEDMKDRLCIRIFEVNVVLATGDAARTAFYLAGISAITGMIYPFLIRNFEVKQCAVQVDGDFEGNHTRYTAHIACGFRPICIVWTVIRHSLRLYRVYKQSEYDGGENHE